VDGFPALGQIRGLRPATTPSADDELSLDRTARLAPGSVMAVPHVHRKPLDRMSVQLCPGSIAASTPQAFLAASWATQLLAVGVASRIITGGVRCWPAQIHQVSSRFEVHGGSATGSLALRLSVSLAGPKPSGSTGPSRL
jgi:hypothetical protein